MKHSIVTIDQDTLTKISQGNRRQARLESGLNDNRFITRSIDSKKTYKRKNKHKTQY